MDWFLADTNRSMTNYSVLVKVVCMVHVHLEHVPGVYTGAPGSMSRELVEKSGSAAMSHCGHGVLDGYK